MIHHITNQMMSAERDFTLFIFGDLQEGTEGFSDEAWQEFEHQFKSCKAKAALGLGDYSDFLRPSMRARLLQPLAHDDSARAQIDNFVRKDQDRLLKKMQFLEGKCIGLHMGHHTWEFTDQSNSDQRIASALRAQYMGWVGSTRLILKPPKNTTGTGYVKTILSMHGNANARRVGPSASWLETNFVNSWDSDFFVMGHGCKNASFVPNQKNLIRRKGPAGEDHQLPRCLIVGGFSKGYTDGWHSSYVERSGYSPQPLGWGVIEFKMSNAKADAIAKGIKPRSTVLTVKAYNVNPDL